MDNIQQYTEMLYNNYSNNSEIKKLLMYIKSLPNVPIELLAKYYIRVYSIQSNFYTDLNTALRKNQKDKYLIFVKVLYESAVGIQKYPQYLKFLFLRVCSIIPI